MVKKLLTLALGLTLAFGAMAQTGNNAGHKTSEPRKDVVFPASDVQYWVGSGSNSAVVIAAWDDNPNGNFALVWGVHWNGSTTALGLIDSIAVHDSRFSYSFSGSLMQGVYYTDDELISGSSMGGWCYYLNGSWAMNAYSNQPVTNGDVIEISSSCMFTMTTAVAATDPNAAFSCLKAQAVSVTGITTTNAMVNITDTSNVNDYTVMLYAGDSLVDSTVIYTQTISYTTLTANTGYTVKVYSNCTDGTQTSSRNASFRTPCVTIEHAELPWVEDFQSYNGQSYASASVSFVSQVFCWDLINPYSTSDPYINNSSSVNPSGGKCLYASSRVSSPTIFVLPPFEDTPDQLQLSFDVLSTYRHGFEAGVIDMTDSTFTPVATCLPDGNGWTHFDVTFAGFSSGRLALRSNDNGPAYLDNVVVEELPSCVKPSQVLVSDVTASSATLTITDPNSSNHYMIYVAEDSVEIYTDTYTLSDLLPNTRYVVNVKTLCSDTTTGTTETSFRTACGPIAIPYHEDFSQFVDVANGYGYPVTDSTLPCWGFLKGRTLDRLELFTPTQSSTYSYGEDGYTLRIYGNNSDSRDLVVLPELEQEINTLEMSFMARPSETGSFGGTLQVGYVTDADDSSTFVAVGNYPCVQFANGYDLCANTFLDAPTGARIALRYLPSGGSAKSWYIDEIDVHDMPACVRAQSISVDNIGTNGFTLHVADPTLVNHYRYYLVSETSADSADFYDTVTTVSDIAASTDYQLQMVSICNDGTLTLPLTILVSTLCAPVTEVPFVENFENWTATQSQGMNRCWNRLYNNSSSSLVTNNYPYCASGSANAYNGFKLLKMYSKGTINGIKEYSVAYLPEFEASVTGLKVRFFYKYIGSTYNISKVKIAVGISDSVVDTTTFTRLATLTPTEIGWNEFEVELSGYTGTGNRITIMQTSTGTTAITSYIDSMVVDTVSSCNRPATFTVDTVTAYGADLTWTDPSEAGTYIVRWSDGTNVDSATVTGETTYALTNLSPSTNYTVDIRSICWGHPTDARTTSFATACAPMPLPWSMNFDNITNMNQLSSCWDRYSGIYVDSTNSATLSTTSSGWSRSTTAFDGSTHVKVNLYGTSCKYWLVTPELNLTKDAELSFDYMLTAYDNSDAPETGSGLDDDRFVVLVTTDDSVWTPIAKWGSDTERDDYSLASVTNTVSHANISLSAFTGQVVRLAFYGESTVSGTDNDLRIDNLIVAVTDTTTPIIPTPEDASIAASDILYWVGEGSNQAVMAVNWADTALAWGYRFSTATVTAQQMMDDIAAADPRFSYTGIGYINDINYIDTAAGMTDTLGITPGNYWWSMLNHMGGMGLADVLHNGDFYKWGDLSVAVVTDSVWVEDGQYNYWSYTYVWPYTIYPVPVPDTTNHTPITPEPPQPGSFCGAVGTEGCTAIKADSSAFVAWATGVSVTRGPKKISDPSLGVASTGADSNAIGMATLNDVFDVVSLGDGGSALVTFANPIRNGEGPDFAVFENGFSDNSLELAFVEVSSDGERFVRFPATCLTQTETQQGNAGQTDPTNLNNLAGKYRIGYGTPFDLEELRDSTGIDIDSIVYVRVVDVVGCIDPQYGTHDQYGNIINDPWPTPFESSGYDLTGVGVIYERIAGVNYYTVAVNTNDSTMGSVTGGGSYAENSQVVLTASPNEGYHFVNWSNGEMTASISILVTSDTSLTATFAANDTAVTYYTVALSSNNSDWGMVVGAGTYAEGTVIEIKAVANEGYHFVDWNDGVTDSVRTITVTADMNFVANFAENTGFDDVMATVEAIWPNPTADYVNVSVNRNVEAVLYDLSGRRMAAYTFNEGNNTLDLSALQRGVYMLRIEGMVSKIVKR